MNENTREQISILMDDELEQGSVFIINALKENIEYRNTWNRYHLIGETMRGHLPDSVDLSIADRISKALDNEPTYNLNPGISSGHSNNFYRPLIGFAIAASVTFVAILGIRQSGIVPGSTTPVPGNDMVAATQADRNADINLVDNSATYTFGKSALPAQTVSATSGRPFSQSSSAQNRLNRYLVNYNEYRTNAGVQGMLPYVRIVAEDVEE